MHKLTKEDQKSLAMSKQKYFPSAQEIYDVKQELWSNPRNYECWDCCEYEFTVYDVHNVPHSVPTFCICVPHADWEKQRREWEENKAAISPYYL